MKVCVVTGTRAEYGLLFWLMKALQNDPFFELQIAVTGAHLSAEFGNTYQEIEHDGFTIDERIDMHLSTSDGSSVTKSVGLALIGFANAFKKLQPDLVLLLGDRYEALAAAQAALFANLPVTHIHGGEASFGAIDESIRHAISKLAHIHFPATERYRQRLIQMGEDPKRVFNVGALGVESAQKTKLMSLEALSQSLNFALSNRFFLITYHPVTLSHTEQRKGIESLLNAVDCFSDVKVLITYPNADATSQELIARLKTYANEQPERVLLIKSLGRVRYLSALQHCLCVIGNSSSGIIEAPSFKVATVNIGSRQQGREKAASVIDCDSSQPHIQNAITKAICKKENRLLDMLNNPYENGTTSEQIITELKRIQLNSLTKKVFYDITSAGVIE